MEANPRGRLKRETKSQLGPKLVQLSGSDHNLARSPGSPRGAALEGAAAVHPNSTVLTSSRLSFLPWRPAPMSLVRSGSAPVQLFTTATAFLDDHEAQEVFVPTNTPVDDTPEPPAALAQEGHALATSTFFPPDSNGFILSRIVENGYTLELQWLSFTKGSSHWMQDDEEREGPFAELDNEPATLPPVRFVFPARLVPSPAFVVTVGDDGQRELQVYAVTEKGYLYALRFAQPRLFYTLAEDAEWCEEFKIASLEGKLPVLVHGVDEARVLVASADGFAASVGIAEGASRSPFEYRERAQS